MNEDTPQSATTSSTEIEATYPEEALKKIQMAVKGNGISSKDVTLKKFEGEVLEFTTTTKLTLQTDISEKTVPGKITGPRKFDNAQMINEAIENEKQRITHQPDIIENIKKIILERDDKGFALDNELLKFPFLNAEFVYYAPCPACKAQGKTECQRCHGHGFEECPQCRGDGMEHCPQCGGNGQISGPKGGYQPCPRCHGHGRMPCSLCNQKRRITCSVCKAAGVISCKQCNGHAWNSHLTIMENNMIGNFDYDQEAVPEKIRALIKRLGPKLPKHVQIKPVEVSKESDSNEIILPYTVRLPHGDIEFIIKGETISALLFGTQGRLINVPFFLEKLIEPAIKKLKLAAKGQGSTEAHLSDAIRYKIIKHAIIASSKFNQKKAKKALLQATPLGLSPETAQNLINMADIALQKITKKPRQIGISIGISLTACITLGYYLTPLKNMIATNLLQNAPSIIGDVIILSIALTAGFLTNRSYIKKARKSALKNIISKNS